MTPRAAGRRQPCTVDDARARLRDARAFLATAELASDPDVKAANAIHAAIAAAALPRMWASRAPSGTSRTRLNRVEGVLHGRVPRRRRRRRLRTAVRGPARSPVALP